LKFTNYNQYQSLLLPIIQYLKSHTLNFQFPLQLNNILLHPTPSTKIPTQIILTTHHKQQSIPFTLNHFLFLTNPTITQTSTYPH
ncbi:oleate hydratase, partial [Staphylococcus epidermidis]|uniref:oleate hydratase n=1 Tax=Staphylococcus epidermidis TaxID=1282 RepID=UPI00164239A7